MGSTGGEIRVAAQRFSVVTGINNRRSGNLHQETTVGVACGLGMGSERPSETRIWEMTVCVPIRRDRSGGFRVQGTRGRLGFRRVAFRR